MSPYDRVKLARAVDRPRGKDFIFGVTQSFFEMHGDRRFGDDGAIIGGIGMLEGKPVTIIAIDKGADTEERMARNFGSPNPEGYRKALRLMKQAEKFKRPVICFVDTSGAYCGIGAEERGQGQAIAENLFEMSTLKVPIITILTGEGGSGGALALSVADEVYMLENSVYSVISPEGCASILFKDSSKASEAAECLKLTAEDLYKLGVIEDIIPEGKDIMSRVKDLLVSRIDVLEKEENLQSKRYDRFRKF
ncbi:MAG: acetyl-CoA carboxylase carboxyltransferase subunit alpha [Firmicutes bacterium]|nr:acetyl-CoA carboxylase carboxyltransferase subunit alpha [Bacillota bacterium]